MAILRLTAALLVLVLPNIAATQEKPAPNPETQGETTSVEDQDGLIPIKAFTAPGHIIRPKISPDGGHVVYREKIRDDSYLTIMPVADREEVKRLKVPLRLNWYRWAGSDKILFSIGRSFSFLGVPLLVPGLYSYNLKTGENEAISERNELLVGGSLLHVDHHGRFLLMAVKKSARAYPSVYRVSLVDDQLVQIIEAQDRINEWVADDNGVVRMGLSFRGRSMRVHYRRTDQEEFREIGKVKFRGKEEDIENSLYDITKIVSESDEGYLLSNRETGRFALYRFNYETREMGEMVFGLPDNDVTDYHLNAEGTELSSVTYTDTRDRIKWFDQKFGKMQAALERAVPDQEVWIQSISSTGERMIVFTTSSVDPGSYYLFDSAARTMDRFGGVNDALDPAKLSPTTPVVYEARDGLKIHAYLTLPRSAKPESLPLIILPHGGPFGVRDTPDYNRDVQFLANRGYAVLQPNYRGSDSYGESFYLAGEGEIGRKIQDDIDDGMDWLVNQGIADADRVCIYGSSYGGYAAMWGVIRNPERYRCGISYAGVTHWKKQIRFSTKLLRSRYRKQLKEAIRGEKGFDLDTVSPAETIARLRRPLLVGQGARDQVVPRSQYDLLLKRAKKANVTLETKLYANDNHDLWRRKNQQDWYQRVEKFLDTHNPAMPNKAAPEALTQDEGQD